MRVCWATDYSGLGNSYGYSVHNVEARKALAAAGVELDQDAPLAVHVAPAHLFRPIEGKRNILYMAWEMEDLPRRYVEAMSRADALVVTASFLLPVVRKHLPDKPVYLCHEGVDIEAFQARRRPRDRGRPFRFLWVGAPNARKGWEIVVEAFGPFYKDERFELHIKTTVTDRLVRLGNITFDSRDMTVGELAVVYHAAHCFVFPSFGEGFGLTMAEAMATGLPVIYTPWSSLLDLAPPEEGVAFPLRYKMVPVQVEPTGGLVKVGDPAAEDSIVTHLAQADTADLAELMMNVWRNYEHALRVGQKAARRIRESFTWTRTGLKMATILKEVADTWQPAHNCAA
jgi:hypothetical protein